MLLVVVLWGALLAGCRYPAQTVETEPPSQPQPRAWIDGPMDGMRLPLEDYELVGHGSDSAGVSAFEWTINGAVSVQPLEEEQQTELVTARWLWSPSASGEYTIQARALNRSGVWSEPAVIRVFVEAVGRLHPVRLTPTAVALVPATAIPTLTPAPTWTLPPTAPPSPRLAMQYISPPVVNQYADCPPGEIEAVVKAFDPDGVDRVELSYRLIEPRSGETSSWYSVTASQTNGDEYLFRFKPAPRDHPLLAFVAPLMERQGERFQLEVQIQFVMRDKKGYSMSSAIFSEVTLKACQR